MNWVWRAKVLGASCVVACAIRQTAGQTPPAASATADSAPLLTLGSPMLRSTMAKMNMAWLFPEKALDFRLKMERPTWGPLSAEELQGRLRGWEIQLPMPGVWVGYETAVDGEQPRATFSIQRGF